MKIMKNSILKSNIDKLGTIGLFITALSHLVVFLYLPLVHLRLD
jgi:hypothetical protein